MKQTTMFALFLFSITGAFYVIWMYSAKINKYDLLPYSKIKNRNDNVELWIIFIKAVSSGSLVKNFRSLIKSLCDHSTTQLNLNLICDKSSVNIARNILNTFHNNCSFDVDYYDRDYSIQQIKDIVNVMTPHFSSFPGTYFSYPFYYLSLGLHRIAPQTQNNVILIDCDLAFEEDVLLLFKEFKKFTNENLIGIAHELSSVYHRILNKYRIENKNIEFGEPVRNTQDSNSSLEISREFPGFNSGVVLLSLEKIRHSSKYQRLILNETVNSLVEKYHFKGTLGDQDYFTLLYLEYPEIFHVLRCGWNRQLCKWWKNAEDDETFEKYFKCNPPIYVYHKNCHTSL